MKHSEYITTFVVGAILLLASCEEITLGDINPDDGSGFELPAHIERLIHWGIPFVQADVSEPALLLYLPNLSEFQLGVLASLVEQVLIIHPLPLVEAARAFAENQRPTAVDSEQASFVVIEHSIVFPIQRIYEFEIVRVLFGGDIVIDRISPTISLIRAEQSPFHEVQRIAELIIPSQTQNGQQDSAARSQNRPTERAPMREFPAAELRLFNEFCAENCLTLAWLTRNFLPLVVPGVSQQSTPQQDAQSSTENADSPASAARRESLSVAISSPKSDSAASIAHGIVSQYSLHAEISISDERRSRALSAGLRLFLRGLLEESFPGYSAQQYKDAINIRRHTAGIRILDYAITNEGMRSTLFRF